MKNLMVDFNSDPFTIGTAKVWGGGRSKDRALTLKNCLKEALMYSSRLQLNIYYVGYNKLSFISAGEP